MKDGRLVILAGGISSRMKKSSTENLEVENKLIKDADEKAKSMIGVGKDYRPFLDYLLFNARESDYYDIVIVIGENDNSIKEYYGSDDIDNDFNGLKISYAVQLIPDGRKKPFGTADALMWGLKSKPEWSGKKFTVCNSDNLYSQKALKIMLNSEYPGALIDYDREALEFEHSRIERFAITIKNKEGFLVDIIEKPSSEIIERVFKQNGYVGVSMNIFSLDYDLIYSILEKLEPNPERDEKELPEAVKKLANKIPNSVFVYPLSEHVPDLTSKSDILNVKKYLEKYYSDFLF
ncbi:MAG: sugar phosphate nucleotidyltransferase [Ignavibacteriaceae bacterium]|jgi:glucose-1-phosphate adenylyltransferase|nr:sugar phosphate nucleotidyltransferase [Ignavibacteriaceae bacterium]